MDKMENMICVLTPEEAAPTLMENARKYPVGFFRPLLMSLSSFVCWLVYGHGLSKMIARHVALVGASEIRIMLTYRTKHREFEWHLSALPCRFGKFLPGEERKIREAFGIAPPLQRKEIGPTIHWFWGDNKS